MEPQQSLRVVVATPLSEELAAEIAQSEPRIELVFEPELLPPSRHPGDHVGDPSFRRTPEQEARFAQLLASADVLYGIPGEEPARLRAVVESNPQLRWVQAMLAGGGSQLRAAGLSDEQLARVTVTTSAGVHAEPLAEFALMGLLAGAKDLGKLIQRQAERRWGERWTMSMLSGQRVLVAGMGHIGRATAKKATALGARVFGLGRSEADEVIEVIHPDDLVARIGEFDSVVLALPATAATEHMFNDEVFRAMKPATTLVNVGRGTVVDESALVRAIEAGTVGFAALDVFEVEPLPASSPLWELPSVLISPHTGALNPAEDRLIAQLFVENVGRYLDGRPLLNVVNTREFY